MPNRFRAYELVQAVLKVLFVAGNAHAQLPRQLIMARGGARCLLGRGHVHGAAVVGHTSVARAPPTLREPPPVRIRSSWFVLRKFFFSFQPVEHDDTEKHADQIKGCQQGKPTSSTVRVHSLWRPGRACHDSGHMSLVSALCLALCLSRSITISTFLERTREARTSNAERSARRLLAPCLVFS